MRHRRFESYRANFRRPRPQEQRESQALTRQSGTHGGSLLFSEQRTPPAAQLGHRHLLSGLVAAILLTAGIGTLAWTYALRPARPFDYLAYWLAWGLCIVAIFLYGLRATARARHHLLALAAYGIVTWLPNWLRSPNQSLFIDELIHLQIVQQITEIGRTQVPVIFFAIPGEFPGLEFCAMALAGATGLSLEAAAHLFTLVNHALIPCIAYLAARGLGLGRRGAFLAALVYAANTSYYFFHAVFSYESLGITFVLVLWAFLSRRPQRFAWRDFILAAPVALALAATHHFSSYILAATVVVAWLARRLVAYFGRRAGIVLERGEGRWRGAAFGAFTALVVALPVIWTAFFTTRTFHYLSSSFLARVDGIATAFQRIINRDSGGRVLFQGSPLPAWERALDFLYLPVLVGLGLVGLALIIRRVGVRQAPAFSLALVPCGPLAWFLTVPAVLTPASELAYRSWPFLFMGLALFAAVALVILAGWLNSRPRLRPYAWPATAGLVTVLLFGSVGIGDNQAGRFPTVTATKAGGPEALTADLTGAARWFEAQEGRYNTLVGDGASLGTFATIGFQSVPLWGHWIPFFAETPGEAAQYLVGTDTEYVVVDRRISELPPRYGYYFSDAELFVPEAQIPGRASSDPLPVALLDKFDRVPYLDRIYDNGNIQIFHYAPDEDTPNGTSPTGDGR